MHVWLLWATAAIWFAFIIYWNTSLPRPAPTNADGTNPAKRPWIIIQFKRPTTPPPPPPSSPSTTESTQPSASRESAQSRSIHQLLVWAAIFTALLPFFYPLNLRFLPNPPWLAPAGFALQAAFAALYLWSRRHLGRNWSGQIQTSQDHQLIRSGPYRILRHPMYTAILGMFLGTALVWGQYHALLALAIAIFAYARKIRLEEPHLRRHFGPAYETYQRESWALIPGII